MARKQSQPHMSDDDRRFIYRTLKKKFDFDEEYPLASLGWCFVREGIDREDYGFLKLKPMLEEMSDFVSTSTKEIGGVSQSMFALREFEPYEADVVEEGCSEASRDASTDDSPSLTDDKKQNENKKANSQKKKEDNKKQDIKKKLEEEKVSYSKKDTNINDEGKPEKQEFVAENNDASGDSMVSFQNDSNTLKSAADGRSTVKDGKSSSSENGFKSFEPAKSDGSGGGIALASEGSKPSVRRSAKSGSSAAGKEESCHKQNAATKPSEGSFAEKGKKTSSPEGAPRRKSKSAVSPKESSSSRFERRARRRVIPGKALERFGYLGTWQEFLATLADLALDEPWDFSDAGLDESTRRFDILHNYIRYTFYRLTLEDKVGFSSDEDFAVFNTGLVDKHYEDIYACFEPSDPDKPEEARYSWTFAGFCTAGTGRLGKRLVRELNPLPQPASYLERKEDLLFDLDREVVCDVHHIVVDNVHRLPINFLRDELALSRECLGILAGVEDLPDSARGERFERLRAAIEGDTRLFNRLSTSINAAIAVAKRQVRWNYKTAVPAYYPRTNSMNLLLPLILTDSPTPDVALVVELQKSGNYQGQTIVTMAQAYRDARLLCRPYIDWLSPASIIDAAEEEYEEE